MLTPNFNMKYIVNPAYNLIRDNNRVILCSRSRIINDFSEQSFWGLIHPLHAQMFSFFDGVHEMEECISDMSDYFDLPVEFIKSVISKFIKNEDSVKIPLGDMVVLFPKMMLIEYTPGAEFYKYAIEDFEVTGEVDLKDLRLHVPQSIMLELTMNCYTNCKYCYAKRNMHITNPLTTERIVELIKEAADLGVSDFDLNGGEVLLHPDYKVIISELIKNGFDPYISTKIPLKASQIEDLIELGIQNIQVSLDTVSTEVLSETLGVGPSYMTLISKMFDLLSKHNIGIIINTIITKYNSSIDAIDKLVDFLSGYKNVVEINFTNATYSIYKDNQNYQNIKTNQAFLGELESHIALLKDKYSAIRFYHSFSNLSNEFRNIQKFESRGFCSGNMNSMVILPDGRVTICEELYDNPVFVIGDVSINTILDVWNSRKAKELYQLSRHVFSNDSLCKACSAFDECRVKQKVCWKEVIAAYGEKNWDYPSPLCPKAPEPLNDIYIR